VTEFRAVSRKNVSRKYTAFVFSFEPFYRYHRVTLLTSRHLHHVVAIRVAAAAAAAAAAAHYKSALALMRM
jgi:hypothetical protein